MIHTDDERRELMAKRLKELRKDKHLSHDELAEIMKGSPSRNSLLNYEKIDNTKNDNLNIQGLKLSALADFYDVTADYILGLTDDPARKPSAVDDLKLSPDAVKVIKKLTGKCQYDTIALNELLESSEFTDLILKIIGLRMALETAERRTCGELVSHYRYAPGEDINDELNMIRLKRLEIDDCITQFLNHEYRYTEIKNKLSHEIDFAEAILIAEEGNNQNGIT